MTTARQLTIGMATYDDFDGVFFSIQALRLYHPEVIQRCAILVVDNNPDSAYGQATKQFLTQVDGQYIPFTDRTGTTVKDLVFTSSITDYTLCIDAHVFLAPGSLQYLLHYLDFCGNDRDLLQGPLIGNDLSVIATHQDPIWRGQMWGIWANEERAKDMNHPPFEITQQGTGAMACVTSAWPGFNPQFRGFGGEEGYIHEKVRQRGGRVMCLPGFRWMHRFGRPGGIPYACRLADKFRNYLIGLRELGMDETPMVEHFKETLPEKEMQQVFNELNTTVAPIITDKPQYVLV